MMKTLLYSMSILLALNVNAAQIPIAIPRFTHAKTNNDICIEKDITQVDVNNILGIDVSNFYKLGQMCQKVKGIIYNAKQSKENDTIDDQRIIQIISNDLEKKIQSIINKQKKCEDELSRIYEYMKSVIQNQDNDIMKIKGENELYQKTEELKQLKKLPPQSSYHQVKIKLLQEKIEEIEAQIQKSIEDAIQKNSVNIEYVRKIYNEKNEENVELKKQIMSIIYLQEKKEDVRLCLQLRKFLRNKILSCLEKSQKVSLDVKYINNERYIIECLEINDNLDDIIDSREIENTLMNAMVNDAIYILKDSSTNTLNMVKEVITVSFLIYCQNQIYVKEQSNELFYENITNVMYDIFNLSKELYEDIHIIDNYTSFDDFKSKLGNINKSLLKHIESFYALSIYEIMYIWHNLSDGTLLRKLNINFNTLMKLIKIKNSCLSPRRHTISAETSPVSGEDSNKRNSIPKMSSIFSPRNKERRNSLVDKADIILSQGNIDTERKRRRNSGVVEDITNILLSMAQKSQQDNENSENAQYS